MNEILPFNTNGNKKQKECATRWIDSSTIDIVYGGAKGGGKSYLGCSLIFGDALIYPETFYFIARKTLKDLKAFTIPSIFEVFDHWGIDDRYYKYNGQDHYFELYNKSRVYLIECRYIPSDPKFYRFGSMQITRGWIEEAGEVHRDAKNNLFATLGRMNNTKYGLTKKLLQTCNPSKNYLYSDYYKPNRDGTLEDWKAFIQALPSDNKMLPDGYVDDLLKVLNKNEKERLIYGNWEYDDDPAALIDYDAITDLFHNEHIQPGGEKYISSDIAMRGRDKFIVSYWHGNVCSFPVIKGKATGKEVEEEIRRVMTERGVWHSNIIVDGDGLGSYLDSYLVDIRLFQNNRAATDDRYANYKSQCAFKLAELINNRQIRIIAEGEVREMITQELEVLKQDNLYKDTQKRKIISKDQMKELLGRSPDFLDVLLMKMDYELYDSGFYSL